MKRFSAILLAFVLIASLTCINALADVIWTPNDKFFEEAYENCVYNGRSYTAEGQDGKVTVYKTPDSKETAAEINNGSTFYVSFTYDDKNGEKWGVVEFTTDASGNATPEYLYKGITGWVRMAELELIYDYISFADDHQSEFKPYAGNYDEFKTIEKVVFWTYPGSGVIASEYEARKTGELFKISQTYTDQSGRLWGFVDYNFGYRNIWVCIDDPSGATLKTAQTPAVTESAAPSGTQPANPEQPVKKIDQTPTVILIAALVAAVAIVTGVLIAVFWKKSTKKDSVPK